MQVISDCCFRSTPELPETASMLQTKWKEAVNIRFCTGIPRNKQTKRVKQSKEYGSWREWSSSETMAFCFGRKNNPESSSAAAPAPAESWDGICGPRRAWSHLSQGQLLSGTAPNNSRATTTLQASVSGLTSRYPDCDNDLGALRGARRSCPYHQHPHAACRSPLQSAAASP